MDSSCWEVSQSPLLACTPVPVGIIGVHIRSHRCLTALISPPLCCVCVCRALVCGIHAQLLDSSNWNSDVWFVIYIWREVGCVVAFSHITPYHPSPPPSLTALPWATCTHVGRASSLRGPVAQGLQGSLAPLSTSSSVSCSVQSSVRVADGLCPLQPVWQLRHLSLERLQTSLRNSRE